MVRLYTQYGMSDAGMLIITYQSLVKRVAKIVLNECMVFERTLLRFAKAANLLLESVRQLDNGGLVVKLKPYKRRRFLDANRRRRARRPPKYLRRNSHR